MVQYVEQIRSLAQGFADTAQIQLLYHTTYSIWRSLLFILL